MQMHHMENNPLLMTQSAIGSRVFRQRLIADAQKKIVFHYASHAGSGREVDQGRNSGDGGGKTGISDMGQFVRDCYLTSLTYDWVIPTRPYPYALPDREGMFALPYEIALKHKVRKQFSSSPELVDGGVYWALPDGTMQAVTQKERMKLGQLQKAKALYSDTSQIFASQEDELLRVETSEYKSITGQLQGTMTTRQRDLAVRMASPCYASVAALALDGKPIQESAKVLISALGRVRNTGMQWDEEKHHVLEWGTGPVQCEAVPGQVSFAHERADKAEVWALDGQGAKMEHIEHQVQNGHLSFGLDAAKTVWYVVQWPGEEAVKDER
jgi:hypothetical protein